MKHLFVVRPGDFDGAGRINANGVKAMQNLGGKIKEILAGGTAYVFSYVEQRGLDSAEVLKTQLGLQGVEEIPGLAYATAAEVLGIVNERRERADGLVAVLSTKIFREFARDFSGRELGQEVDARGLAKCQAVYFDLENRVYSFC